MPLMRKAIVLLLFLVIAGHSFAETGICLVIDLQTGDYATQEGPPPDLLTNLDYKTTKMVMREIPGGTFTMGSPASEPGKLPTDNDEQQHTETVGDYYIGVFEVTQGQYSEIMGSNPSYYQGSTRPVENITWSTARNFLTGLESKTGINFELPTEAQWEYACRAGTATAYSNGSNYDNSFSLGWYYENSWGTKHHEPGKKASNPWGLYDMHGNVYEYVFDNCCLPGSSQKGIRGGSFGNGVSDARSADRMQLTLSSYNNYTGLRAAASTEGIPEPGPEECGTLPPHAEWNDKGMEGYTYISPVPQTEYSENPGDCKWKCREHYLAGPEGSPSYCTAETRDAQCFGSLPNNAQWNDEGKNGQFAQAWNGTEFYPVEKAAEHNIAPGECRWECAENYGYIEGICEYNPRQVQCLGSKPENSIWNDNGQGGQFNQFIVDEQWEPPIEGQITVYSETPGNCKWVCDANYYISPGETKCLYGYRLTEKCDLSASSHRLPENARWNDGDSNTLNNGLFLQTMANGKWFPETKAAFYSETPAECAYACASASRECIIMNYNLCGTGTQDCNNGRWGACTIPEYNKCSVNQRCNTEKVECEFCPEGKKNCDMNLLNGCETDIMTNINSCGGCGNPCASGEACIEGECVPASAENICEGVTCRANSECVRESGQCECSPGFFDCDGNTLNGCESEGPCVAAECASDGDCPTFNECIEGHCVKAEGHCADRKECGDDETCENSFCKQLSCGEGMVASGHLCICKGSVCGTTCQTGTGSCCNSIWNEGLGSCEMSLEGIRERVEGSGSHAAMTLLGLAADSIDEGYVKKGRAQAYIADLKAGIDTGTAGKDGEEKYAEALVSLASGDYESAEQTARSVEITGGAPGEAAAQGAMLLVAAVVVVAAALALFHYRKKGAAPPEDNYLEGDYY